MIRHYPQPLLAPRSAALVDASKREGALGNIVYRKLAADSSLELFAVNPKHRNIMAANHDMLDLALQLGFELQSREAPMSRW